MTVLQAAGVGAVFLVAAVLLARHLPKALLVARPGMRCGFEAGPQAVRSDQASTAAVLARLRHAGFEPLGLLRERWPLWGVAASESLELGSARHRAFAAVRPGKGGEAFWYLLTPFRAGAMALTGNYDRPGWESPDYSAGGVPGAAVDQVLAAHRDRVDRMVARGQVPFDTFTQDSRLAAARLDYRTSPMRRELRLKGAASLAFALAAVGLLVAATRFLTGP